MSTYVKQSLLPRFEYRFDSDYPEGTFDIVCLATRKVIVSLPFFFNEDNVKPEAELVVNALNQFFDRGGYFFGNFLLNSIAVNSKDHIVEQAQAKGVRS